MKKSDRICDECGVIYGLHTIGGSGNIYCLPTNWMTSTFFTDNKKYNVWMISANRWTDYNGQDCNNPPGCSFEQAEIIFQKLSKSFNPSQIEIRLLPLGLKVAKQPTPVNSTPIAKINLVKETEEDRLVRVLTGVRADECACKMPRHQCVYHK